MDPRDRVIALMKEAGIPVTRENYIATNWGEPMPEWTVPFSCGRRSTFFPRLSREPQRREDQPAEVTIVEGLFNTDGSDIF